VYLLSSKDKKKLGHHISKECTWLLDLLEIRVAQKIAQLHLITAHCNVVVLTTLWKATSNRERISTQTAAAMNMSKDEIGGVPVAWRVASDSMRSLVVRGATPSCYFEDIIHNAFRSLYLPSLSTSCLFP
jgi:hypothetical protein